MTTEHTKNSKVIFCLNLEYASDPSDLLEIDLEYYKK